MRRVGKYSDQIGNWLRWKAGRQNPNYKKMFLLGNPFVLPFDVYLLKFGAGAEIQPHQDQVNSGRHYRFNLIIRHAKQGGEFMCPETIFESRSIKIFRPDIYEHAVTKVVSGVRYVISIGWVLRDSDAPSRQ